MARQQHKNTVSNSQVNVSPLEPRKPTYLAKAQEEDIKTDFVDMIEVFKGEMSKSLKEIQENTNTGRK